MDQEKIDNMRSTLSKLEDIKNSQESIIDKINHVITDLFEHPDKELEKAMENAHQRSSDNIETVNEAIEAFEMKINQLELQD
ncbi:hypothetical protein [Zunongwangia pacifica]|uniref:Uncharacterized protein n=1 Tax=Zunongwangia pacifica TaxID=2911062 RepID=A0A9X2CL82_9FLAO|nr:hypothetical protein [Zunongwangia pacifica]MCL6219751.1 hypothetical protein [Zunongwangia pacifica]